jgi:hypothetical protein
MFSHKPGWTEMESNKIFRTPTLAAQLREAGQEGARKARTEAVARIFNGKKAPTTPGVTSKSRKKVARPEAPENLSGISEEADPLHQITLKAVVLADRSPPHYMNSEEACALLGDCSDRAIRKWVSQGMPVEKLPSGELRFLTRDIVSWHCVRRVLMATKRWAGNTFLPIEWARRQSLEMDERGDGVVPPTPMVLVPLEHDHPSREEALRKACDGLVPGELPLGYRHAVRTRQPRPWQGFDYDGDIFSENDE